MPEKKSNKINKKTSLSYGLAFCFYLFRVFLLALFFTVCISKRVVHGYKFSAFSLLPSKGAVRGRYRAKGTTCNDLWYCKQQLGVWGSCKLQGKASLESKGDFPKTSGIFHFKVLKALKLVWFSTYFTPNHKIIQIPMEQALFEEVGENL